ncbi:hypothetical protein LEP1GSC172_1848 [Leptospira noguchii]|uniref:Uncharacterized protein n=1 Tax=Leptospira noguchii TaxID=28182 RepID=M6V8W9_9LEPT|nr:hypothetical protein LEP1GSC172_1848 [Leptospira noguchii]
MNRLANLQHIRKFNYTLSEDSSWKIPLYRMSGNKTITHY